MNELRLTAKSSISTTEFRGEEGLAKAESIKFRPIEAKKIDINLLLNALTNNDDTF